MRTDTLRREGAIPLKIRATRPLFMPVLIGVLRLFGTKWADNSRYKETSGNNDYVIPKSKAGTMSALRYMRKGFVRNGVPKVARRQKVTNTTGSGMPEIGAI